MDFNPQSKLVPIYQAKRDQRLGWPQHMRVNTLLKYVMPLVCCACSMSWTGNAGSRVQRANHQTKVPQVCDSYFKCSAINQVTSWYYCWCSYNAQSQNYTSHKQWEKLISIHFNVWTVIWKGNLQCRFLAWLHLWSSSSVKVDVSRGFNRCLWASS